MDTVSHHLDRHVVDQINTLNCTFIFIFATFVETGHCVVEVCGMRISSFISSLDIFVFGLRMTDRCQYTLRCDIFTELHGTRQFRSGIPTLDTMGFFQRRDVFFRIRILDIFRQLAAGHLHIEVMSFQMKSQDRTVFFRHQLLSRCSCFANHRDGRRRQCRENTGRTMLHMGGNCNTEGLFGTFHKITASTTVNMDFYSARHDIHTFSVYQSGSYHCQIAVSHFQNLIIAYQNRTVFQPALWGKDLAIYNLS